MHSFLFTLLQALGMTVIVKLGCTLDCTRVPELVSQGQGLTQLHRSDVTSTSGIKAEMFLPASSFLRHQRSVLAETLDLAAIFGVKGPWGGGGGPWVGWAGSSVGSSGDIWCKITVPSLEGGEWPGRTNPLLYGMSLGGHGPSQPSNDRPGV